MSQSLARRLSSPLLALPLLLPACGDSTAGESEGTNASTTAGTTAGTAATAGTSAQTDTASGSAPTGTGTQGDTGSTGVTMTTASSGPATSTDPSTSQGSTSASATDPSGTTDGTTGMSCQEFSCSNDFHQVLCDGQLYEQCQGDQGCDPMTNTCINACEAAASNQQSIGCEYYATHMDSLKPDGCLAAFVANTWDTPAHVGVEYNGQVLDPAGFGYLPNGAGPNLTYDNFDPVAGIAPGEVVILLLSGPEGNQGTGRCPLPSAFPNSVIQLGTGMSNSFRITSDVPVVAYQLNPYGGGNVAVTAGSLLLPTSAWGDNYIAVNAYEPDIAGPSLNIIAAEDSTLVTIEPVAAVVGGNGVPAGPANQPLEFMLNAGQQAQITQDAELTGSVIQSDKPIGLMGGHPCMRAPVGTAYCDHGEQMIPPIKALGHEYVGVMHRPRASEPGIWRMVGAVDGTALTWTPDVGGPATLGQGEIQEFVTGEPFVVTSQDEEHPFLLFNIMSGSKWAPYQPTLSDRGDPDYVLNYPPDQYLYNYVFFADPTYPETNLVVVRRPLENTFYDVELDCAGALGGWQPVGEYEWTRFDLITGDFQDNGNCSTGRHEMTSEAPFGLWIWGWGTTMTNPSTQNVSYGYPAGMNVQPINDVEIIIE